MYKATLLILVTFYSAVGQTFLNGSFENNLILNDTINLSNAAFIQKMPYCGSFGTQAGLDILANNYCLIGPQSGNWYIGMSGGGSDAFSLEINTNLSLGQLYQISFYDRFCQLANVPRAWPLMLGVSSNSLTFGTVIFSDTTAIPINTWTKRTVSFVAPNNGKYITVKMNGGSFENGWIVVDNFNFENPTSISTYDEHALEISVSPNPFQNKMYIQFKGGSISKRKISIINTLGQEIIEANTLLDSIDFDLSFLSSGIYFLNVINTYDRKVYKIIKD